MRKRQGKQVHGLTSYNVNTIHDLLKNASEEMDKIKDGGGIEEFFGGLFGRDGGMGEGSDLPTFNQVELARARLILTWLDYQKIRKIS